jgi:hypothetical protein
MTPIEKAKWLAEFYGAIAEGKTAQFRKSARFPWGDISDEIRLGPCLASDTDTWRIKPEPRRMWLKSNYGTPIYDPTTAAELKEKGETVTEWQEVT